MQRALLFLILGAVAAAGVFYGLRQAQRSSQATVAALLPRETVALAHLPDFNGTVDEWHRSDIYRIYEEPAVQEFLKKPSIHFSQNHGPTNSAFHEIEELDAKDAFVALASWADDKPKIVAGFRYHCREDVANRILDSWTAKMDQAKREVVQYQQHQITLFNQPAFPIALVQDQNWIFASNDLDELKAIVDRADGRMKDPKTLLTADESYRESIGAMPSHYAFLLYVQPKTISAKLAAARAALGAPVTADQRTLMEQIRGICATTRFDGGKIHDVLFIGMPRQDQNGDLARHTADLGTRGTFLYTASLVNFSKQFALFSQGAGTNIFGAGLQKITNGLAAAGITANDWNFAFDAEAGMIGDWPEDVHWPTLIAGCGVKDRARATKIVGVLTRAIDEDGEWEEIDRNGVHYWSMTTTPTALAIRPVIGLSNRLLVAGLDIRSVEAAMQRYEKPTSEFANSDTYKRAARSLPAPTNFFAYFDPGLLYSRLDATLRPLLFMGAAFMPAMNDYVDLEKLPAPEVITKHLSPIVSSQRYAGKGYIAESIGPITLNQSGIGIGILAGFGALRGQQFWGGLGALGFPTKVHPPKGSSPGRAGRKGLKSPLGASPQPSPTGTP